MISRNLADLFPSAQSLVDVIINNIEVWKLARNLFQEYSQNGTKSMDILLDPTLEEEVLKAFKQTTEFEDEPNSGVTENVEEIAEERGRQITDHK